MKFEKAISRLDEIKSLLENPEISLDESIELFKESVGCTKECIEALKDTEGKITTIKTGIFHLS